jgi:hypothetical protein
MKREPYRSARRVFWIAEGGLSHRGQAAVERMKDWYRNAVIAIGHLRNPLVRTASAPAGQAGVNAGGLRY